MMGPPFQYYSNFRSTCMEVSSKGGTPKSPILIGLSITNHPFQGSPSLRRTPYCPQYGKIMEIGVPSARPSLPCNAPRFCTERQEKRSDLSLIMVLETKNGTQKKCWFNLLKSSTVQGCAQHPRYKGEDLKNKAVSDTSNSPYGYHCLLIGWSTTEI